MAVTKQMDVWTDFQKELSAQESAIVSMLPRHISRDRFLASAVAAVKQTPGLLKCTPRSLFAAITKSAQDGLLPDGREGVILSYREKEREGDREIWIDKAQWMPMTAGLRKRARELDSIVVDAQVVHEHDEFVWDQGDDPRLTHKPAKLGTPRGRMIGVYAIYRAEGEILHREVMSEEEVEKVRQQSKQPNGVMWTKFTGEAWKKTVVRRGMKSVPCSEPLQTVIQRDDEHFSFDIDPSPENEGLSTTSTGRRGRGPATVIQSKPVTNGGTRPLPPIAGARVDVEVASNEGVRAEEGPPPSSVTPTAPPPPFSDSPDYPAYPDPGEVVMRPTRVVTTQETLYAHAATSSQVNTDTPYEPLYSLSTPPQPQQPKRGRPPRKPDPPQGVQFDSQLWAEGCMKALRYIDDPDEIPKIEQERINPHLSEASPADIEEVMEVLQQVKEQAGLT